VKGAIPQAINQRRITVPARAAHHCNMANETKIIDGKKIAEDIRKEVKVVSYN
jgi:hypothetical protein